MLMARLSPITKYAPPRIAPSAQAWRERRAAIYFTLFVLLISLPLMFSILGDAEKGWVQIVINATALFGPAWILILFGWDGVIQGTSVILAQSVKHEDREVAEERLGKVLEGYTASRSDLACRRVDYTLRIQYERMLPWISGTLKAHDLEGGEPPFEEDLSFELCEALLWAATENGDAYRLAMLSRLTIDYKIDIHNLSSHDRMRAITALKDAQETIPRQFFSYPHLR